MLLPIVLLLAGAGPIQQASRTLAPIPEQTSQAEPMVTNPGANKFLRGPHGKTNVPDKGIILGNGQPTDNVCMSITAYVFSDGENPKLKYTTDCPNLDVPYQTKRAHGNRMGNDAAPALRRTN